MIAAGAPVGSYTITYSYRGEYNSSLNLTVVASSVPTVRVFHTSAPLSASPLLVYLSSQRVLLGSLVQYAGNSVTYSWYVNGNMLSNASSIGIGATVLSSTALANVGSPQTEVRNTITLRVASSANQEHYGEASVVVVVVEPISANLIAALSLSNAAFATALTDKIIFTPVITPVLTSASLGATVAYVFSFYDAVGGKNIAAGLAATPNGTSFLATAPLFSSQTDEWKVVTFSVSVTLNGIPQLRPTSRLTLRSPTSPLLLHGSSKAQRRYLTQRSLHLRLGHCVPLWRKRRMPRLFRPWVPP